MAGSFLAGYLLIQIFGVNRSIYLTAAANVLIGTLALLLSLGVKPRGAPGGIGSGQPSSRPKALAMPPTSLDPSADRSRRTAVLASIFVAGFCALALEVLWTRLLVFVLETSAYAFACMLTCFIFGLATGSLVSSRLLVPRLEIRSSVSGWSSSCWRISVAGSIPLLGLLWHIDLFVIEHWIGPRVSFFADMATHFIDALAVTLVPTLLMGMVFPIAVQVCAPAWDTVSRRRFGQVYAWNTMGCVSGSFVAGFLLIPLLGLHTASSLSWASSLSSRPL